VVRLANLTSSGPIDDGRSERLQDVQNGRTRIGARPQLSISSPSSRLQVAALFGRVQHGERRRKRYRVAFVRCDVVQIEMHRHLEGLVG
jgi:hypothetical protein